MYRFGNYLVGTSNNWCRLHGLPLRHTKRYSHERKDVPKRLRVKYHQMKKVGCDDILIAKYVGNYYIFSGQKHVSKVGSGQKKVGKR